MLAGGGQQMNVNIFGALVAEPIKFPDELEIRVFPLRTSDESSISLPSGKLLFLSAVEHQSWDWVQNAFNINSEGKAELEAGKGIQLRVGWINTSVPKGFEFPDGMEYKVLEP
jgi:hypothetical protein